MNALIIGLKRYAGEVDEKRLRKAYDLITHYHAEQKRKSGDPYITHLLAVADLLLQFEADEDTIIAALLHDIVEDTEMALPEVEAKFGEAVARLVDGVTKIATSKVPEQRQQDKLKSLQKMFEIMQSDIRTILIKLCDRLHNMQTLEALTLEKRKRVARETLEIYVPLTERLSLDALRYGLLQACYQVLFPEKWEAFQTTQKQNEDLAKEMTAKIKSDLQPSDLKFLRVEVRPKIPDITTEKPENLTSLEVADTHLIQIIVPKEKLCYEAVFLLHTLYSGQPNSFRDYITTPKANGYQALHTKVIDREGNIIQLRILTPEMEQVANRGVTLYWRGQKENLEPEHLSKLPIRFKWLEDLGLFSREQKHSFQDMADYLRQDFLSRRILVRDGKGNEYDLPQGATALDFIYTYFPKQAEYVRDIVVNKQEAFSHTVLTAGDKVEFGIDPVPQVETSWLQAVKTYAARKNIQADLEKHPTKRKIVAGEKLLQREFDTHNKGILTRFPARRWRQIARYFQLSNLEDLLQAIGSGVLEAEEVFQVFFAHAKLSPSSTYVFTFALNPGQNPLATIVSLAEEYRVPIAHTRSWSGVDGISVLTELEKVPEEQLAQFIRKLKLDPYLKYFKHKLSFGAKLLLWTYWSAILLTFLSYILFSSSFQSYWEHTKGIDSMIIPYLPLVFLLLVNIFTLQSMRDHISWLRIEKNYLLTQITLNFLSLFLIIWLSWATEIPLQGPILFFILLTSMLVMSYQYMRRALWDIPPLSPEDSPVEKKGNEKIKGYLLRLVAVAIFGVSPLVIRYQLSEVPGLYIAAFSIFLAALLLVPLGIFRWWKHRDKLQDRSSYRPSFFLAVIFDGLTILFYFLSVSLTPASNAVLFFNFAPVIALLCTLFFWHQRVHYLQHRTTVLRIILFFLLGCIGSTLLIVNNFGTENSLIGDAFALLAVGCDVVATLAIIEYTQKKEAFQGIDFIILKVFLLALLFSPFTLFNDFAFSFELNEWSAVLFLAVCNIVLAYYFAYEAYKRISGLISYLLFNLTPVITIFLEVLFFKLWLSSAFIIGALCILIASIGAEYINSRSTRKPLSLNS